MSNFNWKEFLMSPTDGRKSENGLDRKKISIERKLSLISIKRSIIILGLGLTIYSFSCGNTWICNSPLFNNIGAIASFLCLLFCWIVGVLFWLLTGSKDICTWAWKLLPFADQPYRSNLGFFGFFLIVTLICEKLKIFEKFNLAVLHWLRISMWFIVIAIWLFSFLVIMIRLFQPD